MVESAQQGAGEYLAGTLELGNLLVERLESTTGDGLPFGDSARAENSTYFVKGEARVLEHPDEHEPAQGLGSIAALAGIAGVRTEQSLAFVVTDRRRGDLSAFCHLADRQQLGHIPT